MSTGSEVPRVRKDSDRVDVQYTSDQRVFLLSTSRIFGLGSDRSNVDDSQGRCSRKEFEVLLRESEKTVKIPEQGPQKVGRGVESES